MKEIEAAIFSMKTRGSGERDHRLIYHRMGFTWSDLPGTVTELQGIRNILPEAEVFLGAEVTEAKLKALAEDGALNNYRVLHLAAHGLSLPSFPELSAIVLSQAAQDGEDGYLQMSEIADLELGPDLVTLSACDTAAGKIYAGEGVVGLTQSFIIAGAKNVSASLWQISDEATAGFMRGFYRLVFKEGYGYSEALREMKLRFITGREGYGRYKNPFFWASFLLYGGGF
jgi:CHAT domain-containing protein